MTEARLRVGRYGYAIALVLVLLVGAGVRLYHLSVVPTELIVDELDLYNSAHSIATTGHDVDGTLLPFFYSQFTRNPPVYGIASYASSLVFGKNAVGLRVPAVVFGLIAVVLIYFIALELTRRRDIALVAGALQATQPIFVHFSRVAWEPAAEIPFLLGGVYVLLRVFRRAEEADGAPVSFWGLALGAVLLGLTSYTYMAGWFYAVVLGGAMVLLNAQRLRDWGVWAKVLGAVVIWGLVSSAALWMWFLDPLTVGKTLRVATFAHGVSAQTLRVFLVNYFAHFRWSYLVATGDPQPGTTWRYLNGFGAFFSWVVGLAVLGLAFGLRYVGGLWARVWLCVWLAVYPLGGALTNEGAPNAPRTLAGAPVFCILAALGFAVLYSLAGSVGPERFRRVAAAGVRGIFAVAAVVSLVFFSSFYFTRYVHQNSNAWDSGTRAMFAAVRSRHQQFDRVCFSVRQAWYGIDTYTRFYLDDVPIQKVDDVSDPACFGPGTLLVTDNDHRVSRAGFTPIARIADVDGDPFAVLSGRFRPSAKLGERAAPISRKP